MLSNLAKNCKNHLKNKAETMVRAFSNSSSCHSVPLNFFSYKQTKIIGFHKPFTINKETGVWKNKRKFSLASSEVCWSCKEPLKVKTFSCASCGVLQPPGQTTNYFQLMGVSQVYELDVEDLSTKFRNLQMIFHPDKFVNKSKEELEISEKYSRLINKAYTTLKDPLSRGFYILELQNILVAPNAPLAPDFLLTIMDKNEELENIDGKTMLESFLETNNQEVKKQRDKISEAFRHQKWDDAKENLLRLNYYNNLEKKIKEKQAEFDKPTDS